MSHRAGRAHLCSRADQTVFQKLQAAAPDSQKNKDLYMVPAWTVVAVRIQPEKQSYCELHEMKTLLCTSDLMQKKKKNVARLGKYRSGGGTGESAANYLCSAGVDDGRI